jgi:Tfp pilus assembly protein PilX
MTRRLKFRDEQGIAMITGVLVSMVVLFLSVAVFSLSIHNLNSSAYNRERLQAINAAEAGLDSGMFTMQSNGTATLPCTTDGDTTTTPPAHYHVTFTYYSVYPPAGTPMTCPLSTSPSGVVVNSTGTAVVGSQPSVARSMQTQARLAVQYGSLDKAFFSDLNITTTNNLTLNGYQGNDANIYSNGNWTCNNSSDIHGSVTAQGTATFSGTCNVAQDVWANGAISMSNSVAIGHDATSSTSSITMSGPTQIVHNAKTGTACNGCSTRVLGSITTNSVSPAPPVATFPHIEYDQAAWASAGFDVSHVYSSCSSAKTFIQDVGSATKTVVRITPACALSWTNQATVNVRQDLAIITDGSISMTNKMTFQSADGSPHTIYFIMPYSSASNCSGGAHNFSNSNQTIFTNVYVFVYTPCTATFNNNNTGLGGQIYAGNISITNQFSMNYIPIQIPSSSLVNSYRVDIAFVREIQNP